MLDVVAEKLTRIYPMGRGEVVGLREVDLEIPHGELVIIKGESGSGKSTLLSLLAGLDRPTGGSLVVAGVKLDRACSRELTEFRRKSVGIVFQTFNLLPTLTVLENVLLPGLLAGQGRREVSGRAVELLCRLDMERRAGHFPSQLSGGEMQRCAIARALINDPSLILADEPTGNLDSKNGTAVVELLAGLNRELGRTVIIATHSSYADLYGTSGIVLKDGSIVERSGR
jgi:putative ABC transport system ATP-binding protein